MTKRQRAIYLTSVRKRPFYLRKVNNINPYDYVENRIFKETLPTEHYIKKANDNEIVGKRKITNF